MIELDWENRSSILLGWKTSTSAYREARTLVYVRTPQSVMEIRLINLDERHGITNKFKKFF